MNTTFIVGIIGSLILVSGAAYPIEKVSHPAKSVKNWLFAIGGLCMLGYAILNYIAGGTIFFVILQIFINSTSLLMMLNTSDKFDAPFIAVMGLVMIGWSLMLFEGYNTVFFVIGLSGIGLGYALDMGTVKRSAALTLGSALIALFSYIAGDWIFFWLNVFFALFSGYYVFKLSGAKNVMSKPKPA
ncbi:MAG: hypothetical protein QF809_01125 [Candidatus Peribacteraceae bacterium]|jgi:hypothetical protein|nr:hypothetical protein [Candidatus Peribacteraceae bacterium]MDP7646249.1 hypothetical protein [Candidatus Peribacteraceae bacterium]|tara:strand:+ start:984 stop:1541 length:558 start_codon:yes stop_codon:yes gene_type:complete